MVCIWLYVRRDRHSNHEYVLFYLINDNVNNENNLQMREEFETPLPFFEHFEEENLCIEVMSYLEVKHVTKKMGFNRDAWYYLEGTGSFPHLLIVNINGAKTHFELTHGSIPFSGDLEKYFVCTTVEILQGFEPTDPMYHAVKKIKNEIGI